MEGFNERRMVVMGFDLSLEDGRTLVRLSRLAIGKYLEKGEKMEPPDEVSSSLKEKCGVFVTLTKLRGGKKTLRGCIGLPYPLFLLVQATMDAAISAAVSDPRFPSVSAKELNSILIEVSVLTPPEVVKVRKPTEYPSNITVGRDGLIIKCGGSSGLLLPQVATEYGWDSAEFLSQCCIKAGVMPDSWLTEKTQVSKFTAIIFEETTPSGDIIKKEL